MRIGVSTSYMAGGSDFRNAGVSKYARNLLDGMLRQGDRHNWDLYLLEDTEPSPGWAELPHVDIHRVIPGGRGKRAAWDAFAPRRIARERNLDLWLATAQATPGPLAIPRVTVLYDMVPFRFPGSHGSGVGRYLRWVLKRCARVSDHVLTISEVSKKDIVEVAGITAGRVTVMHGGAGSTITRREPGTVSDADLAQLGVPFTRFLLTLGTLEPRKNIPALFEALAELRARGGDPDLGLVVAGGKGWNDEAIGETLGRLGLADHVHFTGYVPDEDLPALMARCQAFVYPSLYEGFGLPVLEAMLGGAPVATSAGTSMVEVGGEAVRYFDPRTPASIADAVAGMLAPGWDRAAAIAAQDVQSARFTWERAAGEALEVIEDVASGKGSRRAGAARSGR